MMDALAHRRLQEEQMDAADLDPAVYARVLTDLAQVNRVVLSARPTLGFLARATRGMRRFSLLDVGFGHGDMLRAIARWAGRRGIEAALTGVDLNPKSAEVARAATPPELGIHYHTGDFRDFRGSDFVISSLVAHHMSHDELIAFLRYMEAEARRGWLVSDLHRHRFAYYSFPLLSGLMRWHPIVRADGRLSIARSYRPREWPALLAEAGIPAGAARVVRHFPFKLCVERLH
jgi:SAM-dependent methyltransferase